MSASRSASSSRIEPGVELLDLDVEVADSAEHLADPAEVIPSFQRAFRQHLGEQRERGPEPAGCDAHVVQLLDVVSEPRAGLLREHGREVPAQDGQGNGAARHLRVDRARAESFRRPGTEIGGQDPGLELAQAGGLQRTCFAQLANERLEPLEGSFRHLDLDPPQACRGPAALLVDRGLVERDLARRQAFGLEREGAAAGAHLEQRQQRLPSCNGAHALAHGSAGTQERRHVGGSERFGHLTPAAQSRDVGRLPRRDP